MATTQAELLRRLRPGEHVVIQGIRPPNSQFTDNHFFVVANTGRGLEVIDAYTNQVSSNLEQYLRENEISSMRRFSAGAFEVTHSSL